MSFGRFPRAWVMSNGLHGFAARERAGENIAALKAYLSIAAYSKFQSWDATLSLSEFEEITKLSRPMLIKGINILAEKNLIMKSCVGRSSIYKMLVNEERPSWAKVPQDAIRRGLRSIPNRGRYPLAALRLYALFLTLRDHNTDEAYVSYKKLGLYTGIRIGDIAIGLNILIVSGLITIRSAKYDENENTFTHNAYLLVGDFGGARHIRPKRALERAEDIL